MFFPIYISALEVTPSLSCNKSRLAINESTTCTIQVNASNDGFKGLKGTLGVSSSGLVISNVAVDSIWNNYGDTNNINVASDNLQTGNVRIATFTVTAKSVIPDTNEYVQIKDVSLTDDSDVESSYGGFTHSIRIPSTNAYLKTLSVENGRLAPEFDKDVKNYTVELADNTTVLKVSSEAEHNKTSISYSDNNVILALDETYTVFVYVTAEDGTKATYSITATRKDNRSSNNNLQSLTLNSKKITLTNAQSYSMTVNNDVTTANVTAKAQDEKAKVEVIGDKKLKVGNNIFKIKVTAENETIKTYQLTVTRKNSSGEVTNLSNNNFLKTLSVKNYDIKFDKKVFEYNLEVENKVENLDITYKTEDTKAKASIEGNTELKEGKNEIKIIVTAENGEKTTYVVNVIRKEKSYDVENKNSSIIAALQSKDSYERVIVNVKGAEEFIISEDVVAAIIESKKQIAYRVFDDTSVKYSIILNGNNFSDYNQKINYKVLFNENNNINIIELVGDKKNLVLDFLQEESFPVGTNFQFRVNQVFSNTNNLYLYRYMDDNSLELIQEGVVVKEGYITVSFEQLGTYVLLEEKIEKIEPIIPEPEPEPKPKKNNTSLYIYIGGGVLLVILIVLLVLIILKKKKDRKKGEQGLDSVIKSDVEQAPIVEVTNNAFPTNDNIDVIDIFDDDFMHINDYLFKMSVIDILDYLQKCPLSGLKNSSIKDGIVVVSLEKDSPLVPVGICPDDVLVEINGQKIINKENFKQMTSALIHGNKVLLKYYRNGELREVEVAI